jgi:hypothetical protein
MKYNVINSEVNSNLLKLINISNYKKNFFGEEKEINSLGFRSDEFKKNHDGKHILFSGCSVTSGVGLLQEEIWPKIVYNKISNEINCSGYFNLGVSASGLCDQIINIFRYFKIYKKPDIIFLMIPDEARFYYYEKKDNTFHHSFVEDKNFMLFIYSQYYMMLESYCKSNNIKLFSTSYVTNTQNYFKQRFETFYPIDSQSLYNFVFNKIEKNKELKYLEKARDNMHYGSAYHEYWADHIFNLYKKDI